MNEMIKKIIIEKVMEFYLYNGYKVIPNYGKYENMPEAICFEKQL